MTLQNNLEWLQDQVQLGKMTAEQANVEMVRMERVRVLINSIPAQVRKSLNEAVKSGYLRRMKKDGMKPEVYYHPDFKHKANQVRNEHETQMVKAIVGTIAYDV